MAGALSRAAGTKVPRSGVPEGQRRDRPSGPARPSGAIAELQRTAGNRHIAQMLGKPAAAALLQRWLQVDGGKLLTRDSQQTDRRELMNKIYYLLREKGYVATAAANGLLVQWITDTELRDWTADRVVDDLVKQETLYRPSHGGSLGPTTLGYRPQFTGAARKLAVKGQARRHVISSSALGRAIERAVEPYRDEGKSNDRQEAYELICSFLKDCHGVVPSGPGSVANLNAAAISAWTVVHNHLGNLWLGQSTENSVFGFIRGTFRAERKKLKSRKEDEPVSIQEILKGISRPAGPGMQRRGAEEVWMEIVREFGRVLSFHADAHAKRHRGDRDKVQAIVAIQLTEEFELNADLDLPQLDEKLAEHGTYLTDVIEVHGELVRKPSLAIFKQGGALRRFMQLNVNPIVQGTQK